MACRTRARSTRRAREGSLQREGPLAMFSGISPRVFWISIGGFFFFGAYEGARSVVDPMFNGKP